MGHELVEARTGDVDRSHIVQTVDIYGFAVMSSLNFSCPLSEL